MGLTHKDIQDLVMSVVNELGPMKLTQIAQEYQDYHVFPTIFKGGKDIKQRSGTEIVETVLLNFDGNAKNTSLFEQDTTSASDGLKRTKTPWAHSQTSYLFEDHEVAMCSGKHELLDLIKVRREQSLGSFAELVEDNYFGCPSGPDDDKTPRGLFYWLVKSTAATSAAANCGFFGAAPSGFTEVGGLNPTTYPSWKNYVAAYYSIDDWSDSGVTVRGDFIEKVRRAYHYTRWTSPLGGSEIGHAYKHNFRLFCNYETVAQLERQLESRNDSLVRDITPLADKVVFRGIPFFPVSKLDSDTSNPIYGVNESTFTTYFLTGFHMRESLIKDAPNQHLVSVVFVDNTYNFVCSDRRRNFVLSKVGTYAA